MHDWVYVDDFLRAGFVCAKREFFEDWQLLNRIYAKYYGTGEQVLLNDLAYSGKYKLKLLDPVKSDIYYGVSSCYGTKTHWDSWKNIVVKDNSLYLNGKKIKILHKAGGSFLPKWNFSDLFTKEVADWLTDLTS